MSVLKTTQSYFMVYLAITKIIPGYTFKIKAWKLYG